ncbi:D-alanyl-D-alanine carboxypeptidase family protein [Cohnella ginsengisoli]|uniref:D-alanyl-D-alanine carboxypeptidase family protein n=1 Tax=Cohnella ginsengisoli TaxID=425004 RepID=A0A9X4QLX4_9BACL|nr:D-alanyl-D-alanine carboxypeptidase family protein [Cohnella ginsengisoli]MDG0790895.1 D-alanyl-D-alanine carboxypeptidase family protein [Cohnella ginsengisoli]
MGQRLFSTAAAGADRELRTHRTIRVARSAVHDGHLILVNQTHPVREPFPADKLSKLDDDPALRTRSPGMLLETTALSRLTELLAACGGGADIVAVSGYRSADEQTDIYESSLRENGPRYTAAYVALPGCSEHQTGLAIDVGLAGGGELDFIAPDFPDSGVCLAFKRLAARFGFVQRYRAGKEAVTGIACEPWHFRYVGTPHAEIMERENLCLEEYVERLRSFAFNGERLLAEDDRERIEIYYVPFGPDAFADVPIPACDYYRLSGDNAGGIIATASTGKRRRSIVG